MESRVGVGREEGRGWYLYASWQQLAPIPIHSGSSQTIHPPQGPAGPGHPTPQPVAPSPSPRSLALSPGAPGPAGSPLGPPPPPWAGQRSQPPLAGPGGQPLGGHHPWRLRSPASGLRHCPEIARSVRVRDKVRVRKMQGYSGGAASWRGLDSPAHTAVLLVLASGVARPSKETAKEAEHQWTQVSQGRVSA